MSPFGGQNRVTVEQQIDAVYEKFFELREPRKHVVFSRGLLSSDVVSDGNGRKRKGNGLQPKGPIFHNDSVSPPSAPARAPPVPQAGNLARDSLDEVEVAQGATAREGPSEEQIEETAQVIAHVGDKLDEEYTKKIKVAIPEISKLIHEAGQTPHYEIFASVLNELIGQERDFATMGFIMTLSYNVVSQYSSIGDSLKGLFRQFLKDAFVPAVEESGDIVKFARSMSKEEGN